MSKRSEKQAKKPKKQPITRTYQYRIYPTAKQTRVLTAWLKWCGEIYNAGATSTYLLTLSEAVDSAVHW